MYGQGAKGHYKKAMLQLQSAVDSNFYVRSAGFYKETVQVDTGKNACSYLWPLRRLIQANNEIEKATGQQHLVSKTMQIIRG